MKLHEALSTGLPISDAPFNYWADSSDIKEMEWRAADILSEKWKVLLPHGLITDDFVCASKIMLGLIAASSGYCPAYITVPDVLGEIYGVGDEDEHAKALKKLVYRDLPKIPTQGCECGAESANTGGHSTWCPKGENK